ncbi:hypothetical protein CTKZ_08420 [Cellulomonas algicola]|uniref:Uncharacterized protein n=1 Tax=Cellulomonas algicola TaxID=2071633 RepID=A0A401UXM2_9CELL|nr:DUF2397 family protein [Cellulomonas algicola]GCD19280.1 hypothetical protein CTKZ_08420 [Cellulomonas algicola]
MTSEAAASSESVIIAVDDGRSVVAYWLSEHADEYAAILDVLEAAVDDLRPTQIVARLRTQEITLDDDAVVRRLESLQRWRAVTGRPDPSDARAAAQLLARNFRYAITGPGRRVHRLYADMRTQQVLREIPITNLNTLVTALEVLATMSRDGQLRDIPAVASHVRAAFDALENLDSGVVAAEDAIVAMAERYDLDTQTTDELKGLLVEYATRAAMHLERGVARARAALDELRPRFDQLADASVTASPDADKIRAGAIRAARGGAASEWHDLDAWCDQTDGRVARFVKRLVRAIPTLHANVRRLTSSSEQGTTRARALALARACHAHPALAEQLAAATLGDHPWRKLYGAPDEDDTIDRVPSWRTGPQIAVPENLRRTARTGSRGRAAAPRDAADARAEIAARQELRRLEHLRALREILSARPGQELTHTAAHLAHAAVLAAIRGRVSTSTRSRTGTSDGLACTIAAAGTDAVICGPGWRAILPNHTVTFHLPGRAPRTTRGNELASAERTS